jgi:hypothetical protein
MIVQTFQYQGIMIVCENDKSDISGRQCKVFGDTKRNVKQMNLYKKGRLSSCRIPRLIEKKNMDIHLHSV